jgi:ADP-dependent NAD(P)H-hydrate dehydratase / NAD(P)H-hydrate epimerase
MKIFTCSQVREIDRFTIENEPVSSAGLMERAAGRLFDWLKRRYERLRPFVIFVGPGNNGGDGLVLARLFREAGFETAVYYVSFTDKVTDDWQSNFDRLSAVGYTSLKTICATDDLPVLNYNDIVIDAIFGSGLSRPVDGIAAEVIKYINGSGCEIISIDMPSGLFGEDNSGNNIEHIVRARLTLTFQFPKLAMMFPENYQFTGEWYVIPIGLHPIKIRNTDTTFHLTAAADIAPLIHKRGKFDHKGVYGHGLLVAGSKDKAGAAILAARAALRTGLGLLTCHTASIAGGVIQGAVPECMIQPDKNENIITSVGPTEKYSSVGVGPGTGVSPETRDSVLELLKSCSLPFVIDADAINILSYDKSNNGLLREGMIITPHLKEFERIAGKSEDGYSRMKLQIAFAVKHRCVVVLKGAYTSVALPDGRVFFNSTGNQGMATAGSGDVLTGIILSLLAQGYEPGNAAITGVFLHGLAGDIASETIPFESIIASDIIDNIGNAFKRIKENF